MRKTEREFYLVGEDYDRKGRKGIRIYYISIMKSAKLIKEYKRGKIFNKTLKIIEARSIKDAFEKYKDNKK